ncbi:uncharacterized protein K452DRAFT_266093 [Aplosporella prunicola CBS 121167]|uniref:DUF6536 domain-containing protein n=1 Tax=Aplosporella prunicola CBS 121167 TaxID=1176127 RepID=A0A6A6BMK6_9PEZI|nr:uncharacterized protein K452DRAFT_266093 [Aplosporella prunicola CBS 121167]KAF2145296.1 hypothetical protein K452DRAFT_266093 [Aplosporella prunicola CBS 121167]
MSSEGQLLPLDNATIESEPSLRSEVPLLNPSAKCSPRASQEEMGSRSITPNPSDDTATLFRISPYIESSNPSSEKHCASQIRTIQGAWKWLQIRLPKSWRTGLILGAVLSSSVLIANIVVAIVASNIVRRETGSGLGIAKVRKGRCANLERIELGIHLAINAISTLLLGASNYCMQCLVAPTRADVDRAHKKGEWLDVGVPSLRNFRFIAPMKLVFWLSLGLSSIPLHLFYNSTFFTSLKNHPYDIYIASENFTKGSWFSDVSVGHEPYRVQAAINGSKQLESDSYFERLENPDCIEEYAKVPQLDRKTVVLISNNSASNNNYLWKHTIPKDLKYTALHAWDFNSSLYAMSHMDVIDGAWKKVRSNATDWTVWGFKVEYCLSEKTKDECTLHVATSLLVVVIVFNAVKLLIITFVAWRMTNKPLITIGDAASSFISDPDMTTHGLCLFAKADVSDQTSSFKRYVLNWSPGPMPYEERNKRRAKAVSKSRWKNTIILIRTTFLQKCRIFISISAILWFYGFAVQSLKSKYGRDDAKLILDLGIGTVSPYTLISGWNMPSSGENAVVATVLVTNLPQALLSILYVLVNSIFTNFSITEEWSRYTRKLRALRVSEPRGAQRSTYFLQLPYRLGIPAMIFSAFLHWIISQSIFVVMVDSETLLSSSSAITCGYSPLGMILTVVAILVLVTFVVGLGIRTLKPGIPMAGSCSAAISAACHAPEGTSECLPVNWGVIPGEETETEDHGKVGHCAFSNGPVEAPVEGRLYA